MPVYFINQIKVLPLVCEKSARPEEKGDQRLHDHSRLSFVERRHHTLLPWERRANSSAIV